MATRSKMDEQDLQIENLLIKHEKKEKVDGKAKGDRTELNLCKLLSKHFGKEFSRALGSGSRWSQVVSLPSHARKTLCGDICVPEGFLWVIESKGGYENDIDLNNVPDGSIARLDEFIKQSEKDAEYSGRKSIICWKRNRKPWLAMVKKEDIGDEGRDFKYLIHYGNWVIVNLDILLCKRSWDHFWFEESKDG